MLTSSDFSSLICFFKLNFRPKKGLSTMNIAWRILPESIQARQTQDSVHTAHQCPNREPSKHSSPIAPFVPTISGPICLS